MSNVKDQREIVKFVLIRTIGNFLLLTAIYGIAMTLGPAVYLEGFYRINKWRNVKYELALLPTPQTETDKKAEEITEEIIQTPTSSPELPVNSTFFGQLAGGDKVEFIQPVSTQFGIVIPKIGANAPVIANVNAADSKYYLPVLKQGVAHALGTVFPGVPGNIFLFAHSTDNFWNVERYNAIFYLLKELEEEDEIDIIYKGKRYIYRVTNKLIVDPNEVKYLTKRLNYEQLTLQTCWPPGTTLKRLLVIAKPEREVL